MRGPACFLNFCLFSVACGILNTPVYPMGAPGDEIKIKNLNYR